MSLTLLLLLVQTPGDLAQDLLPEARAEITSDEIEHHVRVLASDELRGRKAGSPDALRAARYLARALERSGVEPAGDDGFLQAVPLAEYEHTQQPVLVLETRDGESAQAHHGIDFDYFARGVPRSVGPLKLVVAHSAEELPTKADPGVALLVAGNRREARDWIESSGLGDGSGFGLMVRTGGSRPGRGARMPRGGLVRESDPDPADVIMVRGPMRERMLAGEFASVRLTLDVERSARPDQNVVGRIRGAGRPGHPEWANEVIVLSAHYDHLGVGTSDRAMPEKDTIFNGADDDASGCAALLELAEAFMAGERPARTLIFLFAAAEEVGLLGTEHYLDHPAAPLAASICNLNFEMLGRPDPLVGGPGKMWLTGHELTTLGPAFAKAGIDIVADPRPDQNFYRRSDNYAFVERGVIGQTFSSYNLHEDYHHASDEADTLDYEHLQACVQAAYAATRLVANGEITPEWVSSEPAEPAQTGSER